MAGYTTASLIAADTYTDWISPKQSLEPGTAAGFLDFMITGTWAGTLAVQKRHGHSGVYTDPIDVTTYTANTVNLIEDHSVSVQYRIGFRAAPADTYTSGTAIVRLEQ